MNDLEQYFYNNTKRIIYKYPHYLKIYDDYFSKFRNTDVSVVEIGIDRGGSLQMWKDYFGFQAKIYGIDKSDCRYTEDQIEVIVGDQSDINFLNNLKTKIPKIDILIDDGSHVSSHQKITFETLFPYIADNGIYCCEDIFTSYREDYNKDGSFVEYVKNLIDDVQGEIRRTKFTESIKAIHIYCALLIIEKGPFLVVDGIRTGTQ